MTYHKLVLTILFLLVSPFGLADTGSGRLNWEEIDSGKPFRDQYGFGGWKLYRVEVPGGWLVRISSEMVSPGKGGTGAGMGAGITFVPDPNHEWEVEDSKAKKESDD